MSRKKQTVVKLLQSKDEQWLKQLAIIQGDNKSFTVPINRNIDSKEIYGNFYFTEFYTGNEGYGPVPDQPGIPEKISAQRCQAKLDRCNVPLYAKR